MTPAGGCRRRSCAGNAASWQTTVSRRPRRTDCGEVLGGYLAYAGRYELEPAARTVTHRIECGLMPAHVGTELTTAHAPRTGGRVVWELIG